MSTFLSLDWFKEKIEYSVEKATEKLVMKRLNSLIEEEEKKESPKALFNKLMFVNNVITVVMNNGVILSKSEATKDDYDKIMACKSEAELFGILGNKAVVQEKIEQEKEVKKIKAINKGIELLLETNEFKMKEGSLYFKKVPRSIPDVLAEELIQVIYEYGEKTNNDFSKLNEHIEYLALKRFFMWCCLNPRAEVANELFGFLKRNSFRITKQGFFVALRNVVTLDQTNKELVDSISNFYNKVKAVWKKNPDNFRIIQNAKGDYTLEPVTVEVSKGTIVGNLTTLYLNLPNMAENRYTDAHTRTFDIRVGQVVNMPPEECSWSTVDCAEAGLHFTSDQIHYVGCGDTSVLILINPMKVVGIGSAKGRCYEYLPIMTVPREEATKILHDLSFDTLELDEQYAIDELEDLVQKAKEGFTAETTKHSFNLPQISTEQIESLAKSLSDMKKEIINRVKDLT